MCRIVVQFEFQSRFRLFTLLFIAAPALGAVSYLLRASCAPGTAVSSICRVPLRSMSTAFRARLPAMLETCRGRQMANMSKGLEKVLELVERHVGTMDPPDLWHPLDKNVVQLTIHTERLLICLLAGFCFSLYRIKILELAVIMFLATCKILLWLLLNVEKGRCSLAVLHHLLITILTTMVLNK